MINLAIFEYFVQKQSTKNYLKILLFFSEIEKWASYFQLLLFWKYKF